ncbi:MAG: 14-3-3 family protein [Bacillota bacterium]|nr:14-3-3 family protein [Bacillota bacterium]
MLPKPSSIEQGVFLAKVAEQAERYDDMIKFLDPIIKKPEELTVEERNLLSVAYKNISGNHRTAWRQLTAIEENKKYQKYADKTGDFKTKVEKDLKDICNQFINTIDEHLLGKASTPESKAYYLKLKGDYARYMSEALAGSELEDSSKKATDAYKEALKATEGLGDTNPVKLGLALNLSVFYYEIMKNPKEACN